VSKSLLHYHFDSKEDILIEAVTRMSLRISNEVTGRIEGQTPSIERALNAIDALFDLLIMNKERMSFLVEIWATANHNERLRSRLDQFDQLQRRLMKEAIEAALGPLTSELAIPVDRVVLLVQSVVSGFVIQSRFVDHPSEMRALFNDVKQVLFRGAFALKPD
jgi:AcrR family transcriptional regulator